MLERRNYSWGESGGEQKAENTITSLTDSGAFCKNAIISNNSRSKPPDLNATQAEAASFAVIHATLHRKCVKSSIQTEHSQQCFEH